MLVIHARYRGRETHRADIVQRSAEALETLPGVGVFEHLGVEDVRADVATAQALCDVAMALLSDGNWAIGLGFGPQARRWATLAVGRRAGRIHAAGSSRAAQVEQVFTLLAYVLAKRTLEGREATALVRRGMNQNEAAHQLGISKQAMSQRLAAAGWTAESAGLELAVHLITVAEDPTIPPPAD